jgi:hypothetical protein
MVKKFLPTFKIFIQLPPIAPLNYAGSSNTISSTVAGTSQVNTWTPSDEFLEINYPITIDFSIEKSTTSDANTAFFTIYNLNERNRSLILKDRFTQNDLRNGLERRKIIFQSGYGGNLTTTFFGNLIEAYTERKGVDLLTKIEAQDGAYEIYNSISSFSINKTVTQAQLFDMLIKDLNLKRGSVGSVFNNNATSRGKVINGNTYEFMQEEIGEKIFVDNEAINALNVNEFIQGNILLINSASGLLGIPKRTGGLIELDMIYEPTIKLAQLVEIQSEFDSRFDGQYKVVGINHSGTISGSIDSTRTTHLQLLIGTAQLGGLREVS